jgi:hypothetical protein
MATFSKKMMGKEVGDAKVYAKPHTMKGKALTSYKTEVEGSTNPGSGPDRGNPSVEDMSVNYLTNKKQPGPKTSGIKMRGTGAATKGVMSRGPMG